MTYDDIATACGERSGRKDRPVAVAVRLSRSDGDMLVLFPITSRQPPAEGLVQEIPQTEKRRAGLDATLKLWIVLDEYNTDIICQSFHLEPEPPLGRFSKAFFLPLLRAFIARRTEARRIDRRWVTGSSPPCRPRGSSRRRPGWRRRAQR